MNVRYWSLVGKCLQTALFLMLVFCSLALVNLYSQPSFGVFGQAGFNVHSADFRALPTVPNSSPGFKNGSGIGFGGGVFVELPFAEQFGIALRASYTTLNGTLTASESYPISVDGSRIDATSEFTMKAKVGTVGIEPLLRWKPFIDAGLNIYGGARAAFAVRNLFDQDEQLVEPTGRAFFSNGNGSLNRSRNAVFNGAIPNASSLQIGVVTGMCYNIPLTFLDSTRTLVLSPEVFYTLGLTPLANNLTWSVNTLRGGLAFKYTPQPVEQVLQPLPSFQTASTTGRASTKTLSGEIRAYSLNEENSLEVPVVLIHVEEFISRQLYPLVNYVFFDQHSAVIPARYKRLFTSETRFFAEKNFSNADNLQVYYNVLNVIGKRMQASSSATITLVGCLGEVGFGPNSEENDQALARRRAESVQQYLRDVWGIPVTRMLVQSRGLPEKLSNSKNITINAEENRRVEIVSNDWNILKPVVVGDTLREATTPMLKFVMQMASEAGIAKWTITAKQGTKLLRQFSAIGNPDPYFLWNLSRDRLNIPRLEEPLRYSLELVDNNGQEIEATGAIPVAQVTIEKKRQNRTNDKELDVYRLINFDFERPEATQDHQRIMDEFIRPNVKPESSVQVTGYTDASGDVVTNQRLSEGRAEAISTALNIGRRTTKGMGSKVPLYSSNLPEGRLYARTVEVRVETPVQ